MTTTSSALVSIAVVYLRLFVENRLNQLAVSLTRMIREENKGDFLARHVGELVELRLQQIEARLDKAERPS